MSVVSAILCLVCCGLAYGMGRLDGRAQAMSEWQEWAEKLFGGKGGGK